MPTLHIDDASRSITPISYSVMSHGAISDLSNLVEVKSFCGTIFSGDYTTRKGRRSQFLKIVTASIVSGIMVLIQHGIYLADTVHGIGDRKLIQSHAEYSMEIGTLIHFTQLERGATVLYLSSGRDPVASFRLQESYHNTDDAIDRLSRWEPPGSAAHFQSRDSFKQWIRQYRISIFSSNSTLRNVVDFYTTANYLFIDIITNSFKNDDSITMWTELVAYHLLTISKETVGIERAIGSIIYAPGWFEETDQSQLSTLLWYNDVYVLGKEHTGTCVSYSPRMKALMDTLYTGTDLEASINEQRERILARNVSRTENISTAMLWFDNMSQYLDILKKLLDSLAHSLASRTAQEVDEWRGLLTRELILVLVTVTLIVAIVIIMMFVSKQAQTVSSKLQMRKSSLEKERNRSERLILQMLPKLTMKKLLMGSDVFPEEFESVTVLFSDIFGFSELCGHSEPINIVHILNAVYVAIDNMVEKYDVYKVETIGDAYMMASGVPQRNTKHAAELAKLAIQLLGVTDDLGISRTAGEELHLRVGLNSGPVTAGIVGIVMPRYCLFGDTVNIASRMLTTGLPSKIQISGSTYAELPLDGTFRFRTRGDVDVKVSQRGFDGAQTNPIFIHQSVQFMYGDQCRP